MSEVQREMSPVLQTRSALDRNFAAAAISKSPTTTLTSRSHPPARGNAAVQRGTSARRKNGVANTMENTAMPASGLIQSPRAADTSKGPTKGAVQVNDASVNANPARTEPIAFPDRLRTDASTVFRNLLPNGSGMS